MKRALLTLSVIIAAIILIWTFKQDPSPTPDINSKPQAKLQQTAKTATETKEPLFILKTYEGKIGVFRDGQSEPFKILEEVVLKTLPEYDRELLESGIKIYSLEELQALIEDYDS